MKMSTERISLVEVGGYEWFSLSRGEKNIRFLKADRQSFAMIIEIDEDREVVRKVPSLADISKLKYLLDGTLTQERKFEELINLALRLLLAMEDPTEEDAATIASFFRNF